MSAGSRENPRREKLFCRLGRQLLSGLAFCSLTWLPSAQAGMLDVLGTVGKIGGGLILGGGSKAGGPDSFTSSDVVIVTSGEDLIAAALDQIKLGEQIAAKTEAMQAEINKVFTRLRTYQAMQGGIWFNLGKAYYELRRDLLDLNRQNGCSAIEFNRRTQEKRISQIRLLNQVEIKAQAGLSETAETIVLNNKTNHNLRRSVSEIISHNPLIACGFTAQIESQNQALTELLDAYVQRIGDLYLNFDEAEKTFSKISAEFGHAEQEMSNAINKFNEQGALVAAEATKHVGIMALHSAKLSALLRDDSHRSFIENLQVAGQVGNLLKRIAKLTDTLNTFNTTRLQFAGRAATIKEAGAQAQEEITASGITLRSLRKKLNRSWEEQMDAINQAARKEQLKIKNLQLEMVQIEKQNQKMAGRMYARLHDEAKSKADKAFGKPVF